MSGLKNLLIGMALAILVFSVSCCCTGGLDDDDIGLNLPHDQGGVHEQGYAY